MHDETGMCCYFLCRYRPIVFKDGNLKKNFRTMQKYGFESVDLFIKKTSREQALEYKQMLNDHGISVATLFAIYLGEQGVKLSEPDPSSGRTMWIW